LPRTRAFWAKLNGEGKRHVPGWVESANNTLRHSCKCNCQAELFYMYGPDISKFILCRAQHIYIVHSFLVGVTLGRLALRSHFCM
jgi:hypothetical protein